MKNRRTFFKTASTAVLSSLFVGLPKFSFANNSNKAGVVKNAGEGETHFIAETTPITIKVSKKADGIDSASICTGELVPGSSFAVHIHFNNDELFYFHKGSGIFILDGQERTVAEGSVVFVPRGIWHGLKNTGNDVMMFTFGFTPAGFEDYFRQAGTIKGTTFKPKTEEELQLLGKKYGIAFK